MSDSFDKATPEELMIAQAIQIKMNTYLADLCKQANLSTPTHMWVAYRMSLMYLNSSIDFTKQDYGIVKAKQLKEYFIKIIQGHEVL